MDRLQFRNVLTTALRYKVSQKYCIQSPTSYVRWPANILQILLLDGPSNVCLLRTNLFHHTDLPTNTFMNVTRAACSYCLNSFRLTTLVVRNICSDSMLKLIGAHCTNLQILIIANSKQVILGTNVCVVCVCERERKKYIFICPANETSQRDRRLLLVGIVFRGRERGQVRLG